MALPFLLGAYLQHKGAEDASEAEKAGVQAGIESQEAMFNKALELQQPYREAGYGALGGLQALADPAQRGQMLQDYYAGDEYGALSSQVEEQQLRNAAATGGLRGGGNQAALASIAPQLGQNFLTNQQNQLTGLANMGMGAASQGATGAQNFGAQQSALQQQAAMAEAQRILTQSGILSNTLSDATGTLFGLAGGM